MRTAVDIASAIIGFTVVALLKVVWDMNNRLRALEGRISQMLWRKAWENSDEYEERQ